MVALTRLLQCLEEFHNSSGAIEETCDGRNGTSTRQCWCEQASSPFATETQLANTLTNLPHLVLSLYTLLRLANVSGLYACCVGMLVLTSLGSLLHHALPLLEWTLAADLQPMLLTTGLSCVYVCACLADALVPSAPARGALLLVGLAAFASQSIAADGGYGKDYELTEGFATTLIVTIALHAVLWILSSALTTRPRYFEDGANRVDLHLAYALCGAFLGAAVAFQRIEADGCPDWLSGSIGLHGLWHVCVYHVTYNALGLLVVQSAAHAGSDSPWSPAHRWVARWLVVVPLPKRKDAAPSAGFQSLRPAVAL